MPTMETIIDPFNESVDVVTYDYFTGEYTDYLKIIEARIMTFVRLYDNGDGVFIDDEGLYARNQHFFMHRNYPQPLCNKAVFVGCDDEGDSVVPQTPLPVFKKDIVFIGSRYMLSLYIKANGDKVIKDESGYDVDYRPIFFN